MNKGEVEALGGADLRAISAEREATSLSELAGGAWAPELMPNLFRQVARLWYRGWLAYAAASGGRAEDLVMGNPWHTGAALGGDHAAR
jgi:hypothetical protein